MVGAKAPGGLLDYQRPRSSQDRSWESLSSGRFDSGLARISRCVPSIAVTVTSSSFD